VVGWSVIIGSGVFVGSVVSVGKGRLVAATPAVGVSTSACAGVTGPHADSPRARIITNNKQEGIAFILKLHSGVFSE
jgi:hypothetical protein